MARYGAGMSRHRFMPNWHGMYRFLTDKKTDWKPKALVALGIVYLLWPADFLTDLVPIFGWLDDIGFATVVIWYLSRVTDRYLKNGKDV